MSSCQTHCQIHRLQEFTDKMIAENVQHLDYAALHKMATRVSVETLSFLEQWQQRFASGQEVVPLSFFKKYSQYLLPPLQRSSSVSSFEHSARLQAWDLVTSTVTLRGRRGTDGAGLALVARFVPRWRRGRHGFLRGRRGTRRHGRASCVAGVGLGDIDLHFAWQVWHLVTSTFTLRGRRAALWHLASFCMAGVALVTHNFVTQHLLPHHLSHTNLSHTIFHTQLCHTLSFTHTTFTQLCHTHHLWHTTLSHTIFHTPSFTPLCHTPSLTHHLCHPPSFTHHLSHTNLSHTIFDTIFYTPLCHPPSFTPLCHTPSFTHHLSHTTLSDTIFHTPSFTHSFVTHHLSHTALSPTIFDTPLCHTPSFTHHLWHHVSHHFVTHHLSHTTLSHTTLHIQFVLLLDPPPPTLSFLPSPSRYNICCSLLEENDMWGYPVLEFRFWCCQLRKLRKSRRIVLFLMLSSSKIEEVSKFFFVFDVVKFKNWGSLAK